MYGGDRDEIRRRLAMSAFDDDEASSGNRGRHGNQASHAGSSTHNRLLHSATSLQVFLSRIVCGVRTQCVYFKFLWWWSFSC